MISRHVESVFKPVCMLAYIEYIVCTYRYQYKTHTHNTQTTNKTKHESALKIWTRLSHEHSGLFLTEAAVIVSAPWLHHS